MAITIKLKPEIEAALSQEAKKAGTSLGSFIAKFIEQKYLKNTNSKLSKKETELLKKINFGQSNDFWETYKRLVQKRKLEVISEKELAELIQMTNKLEVANAARIKNLIELSKIRNISLDELMKDLDIKPINHG